MKTTKGNKITRPKGLGRDQKPKKNGPKKMKPGIQGQNSKVTPKPIMMKGKLVYQPK